MSHENAKILYQAAQEAQQKFEYFLTGAIGAMFAYTAQNYKPRTLDWSPSVLELASIGCFAVAFFLGLRRLDCLYHILGISSQKDQALGDAKVLNEAIRLIETNPMNCQPRSGSSIQDLAEERDADLRRAKSAKPILDTLNGKIVSFYRWRNFLMIGGFTLIVASKVWSPYFGNAIDLQKPSEKMSPSLPIPSDAVAPPPSPKVVN